MTNIASDKTISVHLSMAQTMELKEKLTLGKNCVKFLTLVRDFGSKRLGQCVCPGNDLPCKTMFV